MDDLDIGETKARIAKQGRRAAKAGLQISETENLSEENLEPTIKDNTKSKNRISGWGEEGSQKNRKSSKNTSNPLEDERLRPKNLLEEETSDSEIPVIPELEEQTEEEDITMQVAEAPVVQLSKILTYRELDNDLKQATFLTLDNEVDLSALTRCLLPESDLIEEDKPWNWEHLFTEISSEIINLSEKKDIELSPTK
ncbi:IFT43 [Acanthosepion pharaonis]|uniref:IFT43 n=1 Tax=Acanthosepion pharaonis TaxID=158019 RepID=A0A812DHJ3_ACAPH|nr:IFT43 [Sepia pharaonis]